MWAAAWRSAAASDAAPRLKRPRYSPIVIGVGLVVLIAGVIVQMEPWYEAVSWQASPDAARAQRNAAAPTPIWLTPTPAGRVASAPPPSQLRPRPTATAVAQAVATLEVTVAQPTPTLEPSELQLTASSFEFADPPEPGAHARLSVSVANPTNDPAGPIVVDLPLDWLAGYRMEATDPPLLDGTQRESSLRLAFRGPTPQSDEALSIQFVAVDEVIDAPTLQVADAEGRAIAQVHPPTQAPPPRPGPIYSIDIPRLHLHSGVVPVEWEPPLFVVGQVKSSAFVTLGNSVLVGHVAGAPGYNIFNRLDQLTPGDEVIANSRGQTYEFVVTETRVLPEDDTTPTLPSSKATLTLMTCTGDWNPFTRDYPDRLWVIAQPKLPATEDEDEATPQHRREL